MVIDSKHLESDLPGPSGTAHGCLKPVQTMRPFFYPSSIAVFGVGAGPSNLAKNIIHNCLELGFTGDIIPVGKNPGIVQPWH